MSERHPNSKYSKELAEKVFARLADGESLTAICNDPEIGVSHSTFRDWVVLDIEGVSAGYARARDKGLDAMADKLLGMTAELLDMPRHLLTSELVAAYRLACDKLQWYLSKLAPKRYGDKLQVDVSHRVEVVDRLRDARTRLARANKVIDVQPSDPCATQTEALLS